MQVRMLCHWPVALDGFNVSTLTNGDVYDVADDLAASLVGTEKAEPVDAPEAAESESVAKAEPGAPENKDAGAAPEDKTPAKPRRRRSAKAN